MENDRKWISQRWRNADESSENADTGYYEFLAELRREKGRA